MVADGGVLWTSYVERAGCMGQIKIVVSMEVVKEEEVRWREEAKRRRAGRTGTGSDSDNWLSKWDWDCAE